MFFLRSILVSWFGALSYNVPLVGFFFSFPIQVPKGFFLFDLRNFLKHWSITSYAKFKVGKMGTSDRSNWNLFEQWIFILVMICI
uniref:Uncharacterized protein n=1 Tax=Nelumbo nucifera TaxID=4432 RepID=A0A822XFH4_NELNU|nr:TPA_asm: hypothetical protein HUJ06_019304 [Nelumbo nucifera]